MLYKVTAANRPPSPPILRGTEPLQADFLQLEGLTIQSPPNLGDLGGDAGSLLLLIYLPKHPLNPRES